MSHRILLLPGDGIGPEVIGEARKVLDVLRSDHGLDVAVEEGLIGGAAIDAMGTPLPQQTQAMAQQADAVLMGAVGGPAWDRNPRELRPERGLLKLRSMMGTYANLRPARVYPGLEDASSLKPELVQGLDLLIVRELTGGIYYGRPRGVEGSGEARVAYNTMHYSVEEIRRIARTAFELARLRGRRLCSVDKANVLEVSQLWREIVTEVGRDYPDVALGHMYVDNAAMQLVRAPAQFDVIVTGNLFGDILSDVAAQLTGSIGLLPSAAIGDGGHGLYEPVHGSAPDIAGQGIANPIAAIGSLAMLLRYSLRRADLADRVEQAIAQVLASGLRGRDLGGEATTAQIGDAIAAAVAGAA